MEVPERLARVEESTKSAHKRLNEHEERIEALEKTYSIMEKMDYKIENVENNVSEIKKKLENNVSEINKKFENTEKQKGMKWDKLIDYIFYAFIAYALYRLGIM